MVTGVHGPTEYLLPGNQSKAGLRFTLFPLVVSVILVENTVNCSKQMTTLKG